MSEPTYYLTHKDEFRGEDGHEKMVQLLIEHNQEEKEGTFVIGIDVGANVGKYIPNIRSLCTESNHKIICVEPNPLNYVKLEEVVTDDILLVNKAVSNKEGVLPFYSYHENNYGGNPHGGLFSGSIGKVIDNVDVTTLDDIIENMGVENYVVKFVKIDTEGHDTMVIEGMSKILAHTKYIIFECSDCLDDARGPGGEKPMERVVKFLDEHDFDVYRLGTVRLLKVNGDGWNDVYEHVKFWSNCFAVRKEDPIMDKLIDNDGFFRT